MSGFMEEWIFHMVFDKIFFTEHKKLITWAGMFWRWKYAQIYMGRRLVMSLMLVSFDLLRTAQMWN